jgi:anaerobic magnesium-protoporphyrin IX monomethyl ester cyclase
VRDTRPDDIGISFSYPLPNTRFYEMVRHQLGSKRNWSDSDDLCVMFKGAYTNQFYRSVRDALREEVDSWKTTGGAAFDQQEHIRELWLEIERAEPASRNSGATQLHRELVLHTESWPHISRASGDFVSIRGLLASTREA